MKMRIYHEKPAPNDFFSCRTADKTSQDVPKARSSRGKDNLILINKGKGRSTCLSKRRSTLFRKGYTLHKKTGVDVLLIVENKRERRFFGTGNLKTQFMEGTLRSKGSKEVKENYFEGMKNDEDYVLPLGKTPSPAGVNPPLVQSRITRILNSHPRRSLDPVLDNCDTRVLNVLTKKAVPVILASDTHQNVKRHF